MRLPRALSGREDADSRCWVVQKPRLRARRQRAFASVHAITTAAAHHQINHAVATSQRWQASSDQLRFDDTGNGLRVVVELFKDSIDVF
jgi:hypothetical protein